MEQGEGEKFPAETRAGLWWMCASALCLLAALLLWWRAHLDGAFVAATLGVVAWFLNLRCRLRRTTLEEEPPEERAHEDQADAD